MLLPSLPQTLVGNNKTPTAFFLTIQFWHCQFLDPHHKVPNHERHLMCSIQVSSFYVPQSCSFTDLHTIITLFCINPNSKRISSFVFIPLLTSLQLKHKEILMGGDSHNAITKSGNAYKELKYLHWGDVQLFTSSSVDKETKPHFILQENLPLPSFENVLICIYVYIYQHYDTHCKISR